MKEEKRFCPYCKKETEQIKQEWAVTMVVWACKICKLLNWQGLKTA